MGATWKLDHPLEAGPFIDWLDKLADEKVRLHASSEGGFDAYEYIAERIDKTGSWLRKGAFRTTGQIERIEAELVCEAWDTFIWELYPELMNEENNGGRGYCSRCHEDVPTESGKCLWCDTVVGEKRGKVWCANEDRLISPNEEGTCWRCGGGTEVNAPPLECGCGCGQIVPRFDPQGRRKDGYVRGHAPQSKERNQDVDVGPFRDFLKQQLEELDVIAALARLHGINRDVAAGVLNGDFDTLPRKDVQRALWVAARGGTGAGLPLRPGAPTFSDLYPDEVRKKVCPGCGGGKAPHAELCKACRRKADRKNGNGRQSRAAHGSRVRAELLDEAHQRHEAGQTLDELAAWLMDKTPYTNPESVKQALSREFKRRGWEVYRGKKREKSHA